MKLDVKINLYNHAMKAARLELGWSQKRLAEECGWGTPNYIAEIESMKMPQGRIRTVRERLYKIANALGMDFNELFPQEYLDAIQKELLPRRKKKFQWCVEVPLEPLLDSWGDNRLMITDGDNLDKIFDNRTLLKQTLDELLADFSDAEKEIIDRRYGINGYEPHTLEETAQALYKHYGRDITRERVRQIEATILRKLRHPTRSKRLRDYL